MFPIAPFSSPSSIFGSSSTDPTRRAFPAKEGSRLLFLFSQALCKVVYDPLRPHALHDGHDFKCAPKLKIEASKIRWTNHGGSSVVLVSRNDRTVLFPTCFGRSAREKGKRKMQFWKMPGSRAVWYLTLALVLLLAGYDRAGGADNPRQSVGEEQFIAGRYGDAVNLLRDLIRSYRFIEFLTLPAYDRLAETDRVSAH